VLLPYNSQKWPTTWVSDRPFGVLSFVSLSWQVSVLMGLRLVTGIFFGISILGETLKVVQVIGLEKETHIHSLENLFCFCFSMILLTFLSFV
jgi:hypothetical protein